MEWVRISDSSLLSTLALLGGSGGLGSFLHGGSLGRGSLGGGGLLLLNGLGGLLLLLGLLGFLVGGLGSGLLLLQVVGEELLVLGSVLLGGLEPVELDLLGLLLSPESLLGDQSLDLGGLVEGLVSLLDLPPHNVLPHIVLLSQAEELSNVRHSLGSESVGLLGVGDSGDVGLSLLEDGELDDSEIGSNNAASAGLSLPLTGSSLSVGSTGYNYI